MRASKFYIYDIETYTNYFSFCGKFEGDSAHQYFEISDRRNDRDALVAHLNYLSQLDCYMVGFNSLGFDWPILQDLINNPYHFSPTRGKHLAQKIIDESNYGQSPLMVPYSKRTVKQLDLVKVHHFDNKNKRTPLKVLQFNMRSESVEDLPYHHNAILNHEQMDRMAEYNLHDVTETENFLKHSMSAIKMREEIIEQGILRGDILNWSDVKIGTEMLASKIGYSKCYEGGRKPRQSYRSEIRFKELILPSIQYRDPQYQAVREWYEGVAIRPQAKEERPHLEVQLAGLPFHFGLGGVHASVSNKVFRASETHAIIDIDVAGMYVAVAIANGFAPEHLGENFSRAYKDIQSSRKQYAKGSTGNKVLKLAGNGVYGNSNNMYSFCYDPKYTFTVTVTGQLQMLQLVEMLASIPGLEIIQANTDGTTVYLRRDTIPYFRQWCKHWEDMTGLVLEDADYSAMWVRDVNNYIALGTNGKVKRKGAYWYPESWDDYEGQWNKDYSSLAVQKAASLCMVHGYTPDVAIKLITDPFDFMLRYKTTGGDKLYIGEQEMLRVTRYYVSTDGKPMKKVRFCPPEKKGRFKRKPGLKDKFYEQVLLEAGVNWDERIHTKNKTKYDDVTTSIQNGWKVTECNHKDNFSWSNLDWSYYEKEVSKIIIKG